jgi:hypothetical protein
LTHQPDRIIWDNPLPSAHWRTQGSHVVRHRLDAIGLSAVNVVD